MNALHVVSRSGLLIGSWIVIAGPPATAQTAPPKEVQSPAPGLRKLAGDDARHAGELDKEIEAAMKADRWGEAIARAEELLALRARVQGPGHFETVGADWQLRTMRRLAPMPLEDRIAYQSLHALDEQAETLLSRGKFAQAQPLFEKALEIRRRLLTDEHPDTATACGNLAANLKALGKYAQAQPLCEKAMEVDRRLLTDEHPNTAHAYGNLAGVLGAQGKYAQAQPLFEKALEIDRRLLSDNHPSTASAFNGLAFILNIQGKYAQAQPLFEKSLEVNRQLLTDNHPHTAIAYQNLAFNLNAQGKYALAQPLYEKALEIDRRLLTDNHPSTAHAYNNLAINLNDQGKYAAAQPLFEKVLDVRRRLLTDEHPDTASSYGNLAANLHEQGKYAQAQPLYEKALEIDRRLLSDNHPSTAKAFNNLASNLAAHGEYAQAQPLIEKALEIDRRLLTDEHPDTAISYEYLAQNLQDQGKYAAAQPLFEKALDVRRRLFTDDHPLVGSSYNELGANLGFQGKFAEARSCFEEALKIKRRLLTDEHPDIAVAYHNVATVLASEGKRAEAQVLYEKALGIWRRLLTDDHPLTANGYDAVAAVLEKQGKYPEAQPLYEKALAIRRGLFTEDHLATARSHGELASNLSAQGKYPEARDQWLRAVKGLDTARLRFAFTGLDRVGTAGSLRPALASVLARLGQPAEAWQALEEDLGRGLLDELAARRGWRLAPAERDRLSVLTAEFDRLDKLVENTPKGLDQAERAARFEDLKHRRELASIALGEFQTRLVADHGPTAGQVAGLDEIRSALSAETALVAWVDIASAGPNAAGPDGEHWGVVVRSRGVPAWIPIGGTGPAGRWTGDDGGLAGRLRTVLRRRPGAEPDELRPLVEKLRAQRLEPLAHALAATTDGLPPARRLIVLPSRSLAGIPVEALLAPGDTRTVSYSPSATVLKYLRDQPRPDRHAGLLALGDPVYERAEGPSEPQPPPDHGLLVNVVVPGSNAAAHGLKPGDVLLAYNGTALRRRDDLKAVPEPGRPVPVETWSNGRVARIDLARGKLGVVFDPRPAPEAIAANRALHDVIVAARGGGGVRPLAGHAPRGRGPRPSLPGRRPARPDPARGRRERARARPPGRIGRAAPVRLHPPGDARRDRRRQPAPLGGDPDPGRPARPARAGAAPGSGLRRPALGPRDPARLGPQGRAGHALGLRDRPGSRGRRRGLRRVHPGAVDIGNAERLPVALEGRRHGDGAADAAVLRQPAGPPRGAVRPDAQGGGAPRGEGLAARPAPRGGAGADREAVGRRRARHGGRGPPAGRARRRGPGRRSRRPALRLAPLLGRLRPGRRPGLNRDRLENPKGR